MDAFQQKRLARIGEILRNARVSRKLSMGDLEELANVSRGTVSKLENGAHEPHLFSFVSICRALGQSIDTVIRLADDVE